MRIGVLNRDLDRLNDLNQEHLDSINEYKQKVMDEKTKYDEDINSFKNDTYTEKMLREELLKKYENLEKDNKKLSREIKLEERNRMIYIDKISDLDSKIIKDQAKIRKVLNKFNDNMDNDMNNLYEKVTNEIKYIVIYS